jgi:flagellar assembly protein FliH
MSSSAEGGTRRRVVRVEDPASSTVQRAAVVAPRGTIVHAASDDPRLEGSSVEERVATAYEEGLAKGRESALSDLLLATELERTAVLEAMAAQLTAACSSVARDRRSIVDEVVCDAVDLAFELVCVLVGEAAPRRDDAVRHALARALALAPDGADLRVRVHPDLDLSTLGLDSLLPATAGSVSVVADASVEETGCIVEAGACRIDAQVGPALERVRAVLESARRNDRDPVLR